MDITPRYRVARIPKKRGFREIHIPDEELMAKLREFLLNEYNSGVGPGPYAFGFVLGKGIKQHAEKHVGKRHVIRIDIKDFFPSVRPPHIIRGWAFEGLKESEIRTRCFELPDDVDVSRLSPPQGLIQLSFIKLKDGSLGLPQGSPMSPYLANLAMKPVDFKIAKLMRSRGEGATYTRYADDLILSSDSRSIIKLSRIVVKILNSHGFTENRRKFRVMRPKGRAPQSICGVVVNEKMALQKKRRHEYRGHLHHLFMTAVSGKNKDGSEVDWREFHGEWKVICGKLSFLRHISPGEYEKYKGKIQAVEAILKARMALVR